MSPQTRDLLAALQRAVAESGVLNPSEQREHKNHHEHDAEQAGGSPTPTVPPPSWGESHSAEQDDQKYNEQNRGHDASPVSASTFVR